MRVLVIVHLEEEFGNLEELALIVSRYARTFDHVINITSSSCVGNNTYYACLAGFKQEEWIWGFDKDYYIEENPEYWIEGKTYIPTSGHDYSQIDDWMHQLRKTDAYTLVGGARHECLQDIYDIFRHLDLRVRVKEELTFGA